MAAENASPWVPLAAVLIGGVLTTISSLIVEKFRDRVREQREVRERRRSALTELERSIVDAHTKILSSSRLVELLQSSPRSKKSETASEDSGGGHLVADSDQLVTDSRTETDALLTVALSEGSGKIELLRSVSLAARVGSPEIQQVLSEYNAIQVKRSHLPSNTAELLEEMENLVGILLDYVAQDLRKLDA